MPPFLRNTGKGWVTAEYGMLPRATSTRTQREATAGKVGGRTQEIQRLIGRSLRSVTRMTELGERTIWIDCDVIQADGGTRTASITGGFVALVARAEEAEGERRAQDAAACRIYVAATSVGVVGGTPMLDLAYDEDSQADVDMNVVKTGDGRFIEVQGTAEGPPFERAGARRAAGARRRRHPAARVDCSARSSATHPAADDPVAHRTGARRRHDQPGKMREIVAILAGRAGRAADAGGLPRRSPSRRRPARRSPRTRGSRRSTTRTRWSCPASPTTPGSRSPRSTTCPASTRRAGKATDYAVKFAKIRELLAARGLETSAARFVCRVALAERGAHRLRVRGGRRRRDRPGAAGRARLRLRPDLLLPAVRPHARRSAARREGDRQPSRSGVCRASYILITPSQLKHVTDSCDMAEARTSKS